MEPLVFKATVQRVTQRHVNAEKMQNQIEYIAQSAERNKTFGFQATFKSRDIDVQQENDGIGGLQYRYTAVITVIKYKYKSVGAVREQWQQCMGVMETAAGTQRWKWIGEGVHMPPKDDTNVNGTPKNGEQQPVVKEPKLVKSRITLDLPQLNDEAQQKHFGRLYNREPHIRIIWDTLNQAVKTQFKERNHVLLRGLAGCGKTEVFLGFVNWLGEDNIWKVDATTITKAGLERELLNRSKEGTLPPVVLIEEIEKVTDERTINCLLQVMDTRGRIQRTNARDGDQYADCNIVVWATCNDSNYLRTFADGAIWSRFPMRPICKRPDQDTMRKILIRTCKEVAEAGGYCGSEKHVDIVVKFMWEQLAGMKEYKKDYNDPRLGRALLSGGDRLLDEGAEGFMSDFAKVCDGDETGEEGE